MIKINVHVKLEKKSIIQRHLKRTIVLVLSFLCILFRIYPVKGKQNTGSGNLVRVIVTCKQDILYFAHNNLKLVVQLV